MASLFHGTIAWLFASLVLMCSLPPPRGHHHQGTCNLHGLESVVLPSNTGTCDNNISSSFSTTTEAESASSVLFDWMGSLLGSRRNGVSMVGFVEAVPNNILPPGQGTPLTSLYVSPTRFSVRTSSSQSGNNFGAGAGQPDPGSAFSADAGGGAGNGDGDGDAPDEYGSLDGIAPIERTAAQMAGLEKHCSSPRTPCTLIDAIRLANPHDTIRFLSGTYYGSYRITKPLILEADPDSAVNRAVLSGRFRQRPLWFDGVAAVVRGLSFINGYGDTAGCLLLTRTQDDHREQNIISNVSFTGCVGYGRASSERGGVAAGALAIVYKRSNSRTVELYGSVFADNYARSSAASGTVMAGGAAFRFGSFLQPRSEFNTPLNMWGVYGGGGYRMGPSASAGGDPSQDEAIRNRRNLLMHSFSHRLAGTVPAPLVTSSATCNNDGTKDTHGTATAGLERSEKDRRTSRDGVWSPVNTASSRAVRNTAYHCDAWAVKMNHEKEPVNKKAIPGEFGVFYRFTNWTLHGFPVYSTRTTIPTSPSAESVWLNYCPHMSGWEIQKFVGAVLSSDDLIGCDGLWVMGNLFHRPLLHPGADIYWLYRDPTPGGVATIVQFQFMCQDFAPMCPLFNVRGLPPPQANLNGHYIEESLFAGSSIYNHPSHWQYYTSAPEGGSGPAEMRSSLSEPKRFVKIPTIWTPEPAYLQHMDSSYEGRSMWGFTMFNDTTGIGSKVIMQSGDSQVAHPIEMASAGWQYWADSDGWLDVAQHGRGKAADKNTMGKVPTPASLQPGATLFDKHHLNKKVPGKNKAGTIQFQCPPRQEMDEVCRIVAFRAAVTFIPDAETPFQLTAYEHAYRPVYRMVGALNTRESGARTNYLFYCQRSMQWVVGATNPDPDEVGFKDPTACDARNLRSGETASFTPMEGLLWYFQEHHDNQSSWNVLVDATVMCVEDASSLNLALYLEQPNVQVSSSTTTTTTRSGVKGDSSSTSRQPSSGGGLVAPCLRSISGTFSAIGTFNGTRVFHCLTTTADGNFLATGAPSQQDDYHPIGKTSYVLAFHQPLWRWHLYLEEDLPRELAAVVRFAHPDVDEEKVYQNAKAARRAARAGAGGHKTGADKNNRKLPDADSIFGGDDDDEDLPVPEYDDDFENPTFEGEDEQQAAGGDDGYSSGVPAALIQHGDTSEGNQEAPRIVKRIPAPIAIGLCHTDTPRKGWPSVVDCSESPLAVSNWRMDPHFRSHQGASASASAYQPDIRTGSGSKTTGSKGAGKSSQGASSDPPPPTESLYHELDHAVMMAEASVGVSKCIVFNISACSSRPQIVGVYKQDGRAMRNGRPVYVQLETYDANLADDVTSTELRDRRMAMERDEEVPKPVMDHLGYPPRRPHRLYYCERAHRWMFSRDAEQKKRNMWSYFGPMPEPEEVDLYGDSAKQSSHGPFEEICESIGIASMRTTASNPFDALFSDFEFGPLAAGAPGVETPIVDVREAHGERYDFTHQRSLEGEQIPFEHRGLSIRRDILQAALMGCWRWESKANGVLHSHEEPYDAQAVHTRDQFTEFPLRPSNNISFASFQRNSAQGEDTSVAAGGLVIYATRSALGSTQTVQMKRTNFDSNVAESLRHDVDAQMGGGTTVFEQYPPPGANDPKDSPSSCGASDNVQDEVIQQVRCPQCVEAQQLLRERQYTSSAGGMVVYNSLLEQAELIGVELRFLRNEGPVGGLLLSNTRGNLNRLVLDDNQGESLAGGLHAQLGGNFTMTNSRCQKNTGFLGGCGSQDMVARSLVIKSEIKNNKALSREGDQFMGGSLITVESTVHQGRIGSASRTSCEMPSYHGQFSCGVGPPAYMGQDQLGCFGVPVVNKNRPAPPPGFVDPFASINNPAGGVPGEPGSEVLSPFEWGFWQGDMSKIFNNAGLYFFYLLAEPFLRLVTLPLSVSLPRFLLAVVLAQILNRFVTPLFLGTADNSGVRRKPRSLHGTKKN